jgi:hypothetical protein
MAVNPGIHAFGIGVIFRLVNREKTGDADVSSP